MGQGYGFARVSWIHGGGLKTCAMDLFTLVVRFFRKVNALVFPVRGLSLFSLMTLLDRVSFAFFLSSVAAVFLILRQASPREIANCSFTFPAGQDAERQMGWQFYRVHRLVYDAVFSPTTKHNGKVEVLISNRLTSSHEWGRLSLPVGACLRSRQSDYPRRAEDGLAVKWPSRANVMVSLGGVDRG